VGIPSVRPGKRRRESGKSFRHQRRRPGHGWRQRPHRMFGPCSRRVVVRKRWRERQTTIQSSHD